MNSVLRGDSSDRGRYNTRNFERKQLERPGLNRYVGWAFLPDGRVIIDKNVPFVTNPSLRINHGNRRAGVPNLRGGAASNFRPIAGGVVLDGCR